MLLACGYSKSPPMLPWPARNIWASVDLCEHAFFSAVFFPSFLWEHRWPRLIYYKYTPEHSPGRAFIMTSSIPLRCFGLLALVVLEWKLFYCRNEMKTWDRFYSAREILFLQQEMVSSSERMFDSFLGNWTIPLKRRVPPEKLFEVTTTSMETILISGNRSDWRIISENAWLSVESWWFRIP